MATALTTAACSGGGGDGQTRGVISAPWGDPQKPLTPTNTYETRGMTALNMIFRGLRKYDPKTGAARNWIADSITTSDQQNFTVGLKKGWTFSNGEPVTAHSFIDAWNYGALVTNHQVNATFFSYIDGYDRVHPASGKPTAKTLSGLVATGPYTFTVRLTQKFSTWPDTLGAVEFFPLPRAFFTHHAAWLKKPIGNGPYEVASYSKGSVMRLRTWKGYKGPDKARNDGVDLRVYTDTHTAYLDLRAGNLDLVDTIPADQLVNVRHDLGSRFINQPAGILIAVGFPMYDPKWTGPRSAMLRQGISMAIDRAAIAERIFHGSSTPATDWTMPVLGAAEGYRPGLCGAVCTYNPSQARRLIREGGGLPGGRMTIAYNDDLSTNRDWVNAVCNSINNVLGDDHACAGAPVGTFAELRDQIAGKSETGLFNYTGQMDYPLIQDSLQPNYTTDGTYNDTRFHSPRFDALVNRANAQPTTALTVATYQQAERILAQQVPSIPLWYQNGTAGYSSRLSHVSLNIFSVPEFSQITVR
ncbi:ABC transporter substrate-binding protein [Streptomyces sp. NPDC007205]|uniref:peptide ABC transporter substrate-binding protein n=1 Tax=Streptomyces sp. NPDC007205 TaxID=3154316 RepID=UPI0033DE09BB